MDGAQDLDGRPVGRKAQPLSNAREADQELVECVADGPVDFLVYLSVVGVMVSVLQRSLGFPHTRQPMEDDPMDFLRLFVESLEDVVPATIQTLKETGIPRRHRDRRSVGGLGDGHGVS